MRAKYVLIFGDRDMYLRYYSESAKRRFVYCDSYKSVSFARTRRYFGYLVFSRKQDPLDTAMVRWREIQYREYYKDRAREKLDDTPFLHLSPPQYNTKSFLLFSRLKLKFRVLKLVRNRNSLHARGLNVYQREKDGLS